MRNNAGVMPKATAVQSVRTRRVPALVMGLALLIVGATITGTLLYLRQKIRAQIASRDGEVLYAVSLMQQFEDEAEGPAVASLAEPGEQFNLIIRISRLKGVIGIRLFSPDGKFVNAFPAYITEAALQPGNLAPLRALQPVSHYRPSVRLDEVDLLAQNAGGPVPLLLVNVPLHDKNQRNLLGVAQFILEGGSIARELAQLDRHLALQGIVVFLVGGGLLALALALAFHRIQKANRLLSERTASLLRANQELALAAKTSAVGAVTSHLIHGLKNPLSGLQSFVTSHLENREISNDSDWREAVATTRRMQNLIGEVVRILGDQQAEAEYELSLAELVEMVSSRVQPAAGAARVQFNVQTEGAATFSNREANLLLLILENLLQNAFQATPAGKSVQLSAKPAGENILFRVQDEGSGLPPGLEERLFTPCRSTKEGGSGIGLAISRQLAAHLEATLELKSSSASGCMFQLTVPRASRSQPVDGAAA